MPPTAIIVGAGPGGLAAGMLLAKAGVRVKVVEAQPFVGGRTSTLTDSGYAFDRGPTFFLYPRILRETFAACGYDLFAECPMERLDPQYRLVFGAESSGKWDPAKQTRLDATPDVDRMEREIARLSPADAPGFRRFLKDNKQKLDRFQPILEAPFDKLTDYLRPDVLRSAPLLRPWRQLYGEIGRFFKDPRLNLAFTFQGKYLGMSPFQCPSLFSILAYLEYDYGVWHPIGGCGAVSTRMGQIIEELGGEVSTGEPVEELLFEGDRVAGVRTNRGEQTADAVVVNADFAAAMHKLVPDNKRRRWTDRKLAKKRYSCSTLMFYLGLEGTQPDLPHHTIYLSSDYRRNLADIELGRPLGPDPSVYVQNACVTDPSLAPPGCSTLYVLVPTANTNSGVDWRAERDRLRPVVFEQLAKLGVEDAAERVRLEHTISPSDWRDDHRIYRGATFNLAHSLDQMLYFRPHNRFEDFEGTYLVGGGTHPGSGLPTIYSSARITVASLLKDFGIDMPTTNEQPESAVREPAA